MATIKKTNIYNYLKTKFSNTASHIKMNGSQSAGSSDLMARADHVHPSDTSRAPTSHKSTGTSYGVSDASNYGHAMASGTTPKVDGTAAVGSETAKFARGDHVHPTDTSRAPTSHASSATTYGVGSASNYGHVKVDASPTDSSNNAVASGGVKTVLDTKQNAVETQAKVTQFTNKDRINIDRILPYVDPTLGDNHYYELHLWTPDNGTWVDDKCKGIGTGIKCILSKGRNRSSTVNGVTYTLKKTDGTVIMTGTTDDSTSTWDPLPYSLSVGIHYLYAECTYDGSVWKSNILTVFVKDNNNLYDHARWSCGEYDNINIITNYGKAKITEQFSTIGEKSIAYQQSNPANYGYFYVDSTNTLNSGENYTVSVDCYCPDANFTFIVRQDGELSRVTIPRNPSMQHISLSFTSNRSASFRIQFFNDVSDSRIFIDNLSCIKL